jgi:MFS family permease
MARVIQKVSLIFIGAFVGAVIGAALAGLVGCFTGDGIIIINSAIFGSMIGAVGGGITGLVNSNSAERSPSPTSVRSFIHAILFGSVNELPKTSGTFLIVSAGAILGLLLSWDWSSWWIFCPLGVLLALISSLSAAHILSRIDTVA